MTKPSAPRCPKCRSDRRMVRCTTYLPEDVYVCDHAWHDSVDAPAPTQAEFINAWASRERAESVAPPGDEACRIATKAEPLIRAFVDVRPTIEAAEDLLRYVTNPRNIPANNLRHHIAQLKAESVAPESHADREYLLEVIAGARDVIASFIQELGKVPGGYSTNLTENERLAYKTVADLNEILSTQLLAGAPTQPAETQMREALVAAVPWLFEHGHHTHQHCYQGSDDSCYCGLDEAKKIVEAALRSSDTPDQFRDVTKVITKQPYVSQANARLIAAAPALLEALEAIVVSAHDGNEPGQTWIMIAGGLIDSAEAAIALARGDRP